MSWNGTGHPPSRQYTCGYCGRHVASNVGYVNPSKSWVIHICPNCNRPTSFLDSGQLPGTAPGAEVASLPAEIDGLYREARKSVAAGCHTGAVLLCRKLLMHIGVAQGAPTGEPFLAYVEYLADKGFVPPGGKGWVDHIRKRGNEANHEIVLMSSDNADELLLFIEMLLKFIYEFPNKIPKTP